MKGNTISVGQKLIVNKGAVNKYTVNESEARQVASLNTAIPEPSRRVHKVSGGETLSGIALRYQSTVAAIRRQNKLNGNSIRIGQRLVIPSIDS